MSNKPRSNMPGANGGNATKTRTTSAPRRTRRSRRFARLRGGPTSIPSAFGYRSRARTQVSRARNDGSVVIRTKEIFPITYTSQNSEDQVAWMLPCTPTKWTNTRTATQCSIYSSYRPAFMRVSWRPNVGTHTNGSIAFGTLWDSSAVNFVDKPAVMQALTASNGGFVSSIYLRTSSKIALSTNLRANTFPCFDVQPDDIPFWLAVCIDAEESANILGNIEVTSVFIMHNTVTNSRPSTSVNNAPADIVHDDATLEVKERSILRIPARVTIPNITELQDYWFYFARPLFDTNSKPIIPALKAVVGNYAGIDTMDEVDYHIFEINDKINSISPLLCTLGGSIPGFMQ